jgi:hypothetical protein
LEEVKAARVRLVRMVSKGTFTEEDVEEQMAELKEREAKLQARSAQLLATIEQFPDPEAVRGRVRKMADMRLELESDYRLMSDDDKRALCQTVFGGRTPDGKRMGVYVEPEAVEGGKVVRWAYTVRGHLIESSGFFPLPPADTVPYDEHGPFDPAEGAFSYHDIVKVGPDAGRKLLEAAATKSANGYTAPAPRARRSGAPPPPPAA